MILSILFFIVVPTCWHHQAIVSSNQYVLLSSARVSQKLSRPPILLSRGSDVGDFSWCCWRSFGDGLQESRTQITKSGITTEKGKIKLLREKSSPGPC